jgi:D-alanyl-D-alanine carboxypeptidase (penicillin-binding protein 5/6)
MRLKNRFASPAAFLTLLSLSVLFLPSQIFAAKSWTGTRPGIFLTAKSCVIIDMRAGTILYGKMPHLKLPPASTTKVMTVLLARERLPMKQKVTISRNAANVAPSKAGLTMGAQYSVEDLITAALVASSNDAALALAEAMAGSERQFMNLMNLKARELGMNDTFFVNSTGLTDKSRKQYTTAYDLARLMRVAVKDKHVDDILAITEASITGSDGKLIPLRAHNKMLWKIPKFVKGKTGWTTASRHTFVGTNYAPNKSIAFAMLSSQKPWTDIERLASFGLALERAR